MTQLFLVSEVIITRQLGIFSAINIRNGWMDCDSNTRWWQLKYFWNFHPDLWGNDPQFDEHILQMGWFNHQPIERLANNSLD